MSRSRMLADARTALAVREMQLKASELAVGRQVERTEKARQTLIAAEAELTATEMELAAVLTDPMIDLRGDIAGVALGAGYSCLRRDDVEMAGRCNQRLVRALVCACADSTPGI